MPSTSGRLLIAEPMLGDPNFDRTVILVVDHTPDGAFGLVLNRPTDLPVAGILPGWALLASAPAVLHVGGPVEAESGWCLARVRHPDRPWFVPVRGDVGLLDLDQEPDDLDDEVLALRLYAGYSGWGPGQLDAELAEDAWIVADATGDDPFLEEGADLWPRILARQGGRLARLATFPPDPSLN
jgi:putative transcriptional regulator